MRVSFFTEDAFGPQFIIRLIPILRNHGLIDEDTIVGKSRAFPKCNPKLGKMVSASSLFFDRAVVLVDAEGYATDIVESKTRNHIKDKDALAITRFVVMQYEIEEWICESEEFNLEGSKPSEILKTKLRYEKFQLPLYAERMHLERMRNCRSFQDFIRALI